MNIPFYRYVEYEDDGHYIYQCLNCGEKIDVGHNHFNYNPRFCSFCGVEYKGFVLPKEIEYVRYNYERICYVIQTGIKLNNNDGEIDWQDSWRKTYDAKIAIKYLNDAKIEQEYDNKCCPSLIWSRRLIRKKENAYSYNEIDKDKYYLKTGKKFKRCC